MQVPQEKPGTGSDTTLPQAYLAWVPSISKTKRARGDCATRLYLRVKQSTRVYAGTDSDARELLLSIMVIVRTSFWGKDSTVEIRFRGCSRDKRLGACHWPRRIVGVWGFNTRTLDR